MTEYTNKNLGFLSSEILATKLRSMLDEIEVAATHGNHASTTVLAVSVIEGLCNDLVGLEGITAEQVPKQWDQFDGKYVDRSRLRLITLLKILRKAKMLPKAFLPYYDTLRVERNRIHPAADSSDRPSIPLSTAQLSLAALNALIEKYEAIRFAGGQKWRLTNGIATVVESNRIYLPAASHSIPLLVSEEPATTFQSLVCQVHIPQDGILNFVYSYVSQDHFMAARIEGRNDNGRGRDNGKLVCHKWTEWRIDADYTVASEPDPAMREFELKVVMGSQGHFAVFVNGTQLELEGDVGWDFDPNGKIGFLAEQKNITISNLVCVPASASGAVSP